MQHRVTPKKAAKRPAAAARATATRSAPRAPAGEYPQLAFPSLRGKVSAAEWETRVDCACAYRLVHHYGMDDLIYNHISARIPGTEHFLLNPYGMLYEEICASSLIKVDIEGNVLSAPRFPEGLDYQLNRAGFVIHSAVHRAKPEVMCVIHTHSLATMAVSSLECGLIPMTQTAMRWERVAYHDYQGVVLDLTEQRSLLEDLGDSEVMLLRNHGVLAIGNSVGQAFNNTYRMERSCRSQLMAMACNTRLVALPPDVIERTVHQYRPSTRRVYGVLEWPAMRRLADRIDPSYKH